MLRIPQHVSLKVKPIDLKGNFRKSLLEKQVHFKSGGFLTVLFVLDLGVKCEYGCGPTEDWEGSQNPF